MRYQHLLRFPFKGQELIPRSYSQIGQDIFVCSVLDGHSGGTYVEIGAHDPKKISNTYMLETDLNYRGVSLDIVPQVVELMNQTRRNPTVLEDARTADYARLLAPLAPDGIIDYASVDCEPSYNTFMALSQLLTSGLKFRVITFEHDSYQDSWGIKQASRRLLQDHGYTLLVGGVQGQPGAYDMEDWYVLEQAVDWARVQLMHCPEQNVYWAEYLYHTIPPFTLEDITY